MHVLRVDIFIDFVWGLRIVRLQLQIVFVTGLYHFHFFGLAPVFALVVIMIVFLESFNAELLMERYAIFFLRLFNSALLDLALCILKHDF